MIPVWLLDVDGVINAIAKKGDPSVWPTDQWVKAEAWGAMEKWPILAAQPVIDFLTQVHEGGHAEIRWHTTWQQHADNVSRALGLPEFPIQPCPEFGEKLSDYLGGRTLPRGLDTWWKLPAVERLLGEGHRVVWTDDDARRELRTTEHTALLARTDLQLIVPPGNTGLTPNHLREIRAFLRMPAPNQPQPATT